MSDIDVNTLTIARVHEQLMNGDFTVRELVDAYQRQIADKNDDLNVYLTTFDDVLVADAQEKIDNKTATLLTGIPFAIKDIIQLKEKRATGGSKILENYTSPYDATVITKLREAGAIFLGKVNTDEFAQGASTENSAYGVTKNPHDITRVAGGSSGGSAAAVAAGMALAALGTDTGGSIRQPAAFCGVVGLKPTYGSVSRHGLMAMASSFDVAGPITRTVEDAEIIFNTIKGVDPMDSTTAEGTTDKKVKTIGVPRSFLKKGIDKDVLELFEASLARLEGQGYEIKDIDIETIDKALAVYYILVPAEVSSNMSRYDGIKYGEVEKSDDLLTHYMKTRGKFLGTEVKRRIMLGTYVLSAGYADQFYTKGWQVRNTIKKEFEEVFRDVDVIAMPVTPTPAFTIGANEDPLQMYLLDIFTVAANVIGSPAISIPNGFVERDEKKLPTGLQLIAPHFGENMLFEVGKKFETIE